jgi:hypothetical protein
MAAKPQLPPQAHHEADGEERTWLVWIADLLPHALASDIRALVKQAAAVIKPTLEGWTREG